MAKLGSFARGRCAAFAASSALALLTTAWLGSFPERSERGVADALARAAGAEVEASDVIWEPTRGAAVDALWGRGVAFLARLPSPDGAARRDVFRARVTVAPGGSPMRVVELERRTDTPLVDEHSVMARGEAIAWLARGEGGEHGATFLAPTGDRSIVGAILAMRAGLPLRSVVHVVAEVPVETLRGELTGEGLVLAATRESARIAVLFDPRSRTAIASGEGPRWVVASGAAPRGFTWPWKREPPAVIDPLPARGELQADEVFPPGEGAWAPLLEAQVAVKGERPAPAPIARAEVLALGEQVELLAFDLRQLSAHVVPGPDAPLARSGLPGTGRLPAALSARVVARVPALPLRLDGGAIDGGRSVAPLEPASPTLAADTQGHLLVGAPPDAPMGALQSREPAPDERVEGWCLIGREVAVFARAQSRAREPAERALRALGCESIVWVAPSPGLAPEVGGIDGEAPRPEPFVAFSRRSAFPEGRSDTWKASPGLQPTPAFAPGLLERHESVLGVEVRVFAFVAGRFRWAIRAGTAERSHRMKGVFPETLGDDMAPRVAASWGLGIGQRRTPNGLTIGGSTGHRYAGRGAVLLATGEGLRLLRSSELRGDPEGDASELPLTGEGGTPNAEARRRGLLHDRADLCVLPDRTVLIAVARFDSHEATAEVLCRAGCSEVAALDRGADRPATFHRASPSTPQPATFEDTQLFALVEGQN